MLVSLDLKEYVLKFIVYPNKNDFIMMIGENYFKFWEVNYTQRNMKENKWSDIPMWLERDSTFVDAEFIEGTEIFVMISSRNHIYVYNGLTNLHIMENVQIESKEIQNETTHIGVDCEDIRPKDEVMGAKS